jgi:hypothetical protein
MKYFQSSEQRVHGFQMLTSLKRNHVFCIGTKEKMSWKHVKNWPGAHPSQDQRYKVLSHFWEEISCYPPSTGPPKEVFCHCSCSAIQSLVKLWFTGYKQVLELGGPQCYAWDVGFDGLQNFGLTGSWRLPPRLQKKTWEARQCMAGLEFLQTALERAVC